MRRFLSNNKIHIINKNNIKKYLMISILFMFLSLFLHSIYISNLEKFSNKVNAHVYQQNNFVGFGSLYFEIEKKLINPKIQIYKLGMSELIYSRIFVINEFVFTQVNKLIFSNTDSRTDLSLQVSSIIINTEKIEEKKEDYIEELYSILVYLIFIIPLIILSFSIYKKHNEMNNFFMNILRSIGIYIGTGLIYTLIIFIIYILKITTSYKTKYFWFGLLSTIFIINSIILFIVAYFARKNNKFESFIISMIFALMQVVSLPILLIQSLGNSYSNIIIQISLFIGAIILFTSFIILWKYVNKENKENKEIKINLLLLFTYLILIISFIFITIIFQAESIIKDKKLWIGFSVLIILIPFGNYIGRMLREKNRMIIPLLISIYAVIWMVFLILNMVSLETTFITVNNDSEIIKSPSYNSKVLFKVNGYINNPLNFILKKSNIFKYWLN